MIAKCEDCTFYVVGKPNAIMYREGVCHRYPETLHTMKVHWCGEFSPKTVNKPSVKKKKRAKKVQQKKSTN